MIRSQIYTYCFAVFLLVFCNVAQSIEEPKYTLIGTIGKVEFRHYDAVIQARTTLLNSGETAAGFRRLAGFIFGGNDAGQKIAMTAPVQETIAREQVELAFTMPGEYSLETLPAPDDPSVSLTHVPARTVAVISFSGWATPGKVQRYQQQLVEYLESQEIASVAAPMLNQYNPPWTPPFLRRNEIMLEIAESTPLTQVGAKASNRATSNPSYVPHYTF